MELDIFLYFALIVAAAEVNADITPVDIVKNGFDVAQLIESPEDLFNFILKFVQDISASGSRNLDDYAALARISDALNNISADVEDIRNKLSKKLIKDRWRSGDVFAERLEELLALKGKIDRYFEKLQNLLIIDISTSYPSSIKDDFIETILAPNANSVNSLLAQIFQMVINKGWAAVFETLADTSLTSTLACSSGRPQQFVIYNIFLAICATEIKGYILKLYAMAEKAKNSRNKPYFESDMTNFRMYFFEITFDLKQAIKTASRSYWSCPDQSESYTSEGEIQAQFGQFLQMSLDLRPIEANATENEVVVGLRFRMQSGMLSIEAKIAKLLPSGKIDKKSQIWRGQNSKLCDLDKLVEYEDYVKLSELGRSFVLDDVELGNDYVLTGVKFVYENGFNKLAARGHKFDFKNGTIDMTEEIWVVSGKSKPESEYSEFLLDNLNDPKPYNDIEVDSHNGGIKNEKIVQFVKLTTTSSKTNVGQSVVPFIHKVPVVPEQLLPLSGVGLIHTGNKKSAGYLALKIIGYNFEPRISMILFHKP